LIAPTLKDPVIISVYICWQMAYANQSDY